MDCLKLTSSIPVSVNHYIKPHSFIKNGKAVATLYETVDAKQFKQNLTDYIKKQIKIQDFKCIVNKTQHFYIDCIFYFDRIDKDPNNYFKILLDAITDSQCIWLDDNVVCERVNAIYYDTKNPRIEMTIYPVDYIGIFDNRKQLEIFKSKCMRCRKYKEGKCKTLCKAIEGHIQENVDGQKCCKYKPNMKAMEELICTKF